MLRCHQFCNDVVHRTDLFPKEPHVHLVGNVLGTASYHTIYQSNASNATDAGNSANGILSIFTMGYSGNQGTRQVSPFTIDNDTLAATSTMLWGNYDVVNSAVRFNTGEDAHAAPTYPGITGASQTLPASFYLSAKPGWWPSGKAWPPIGPDVTGGNVTGVGGHATNRRRHIRDC